MNKNDKKAILKNNSKSNLITHANHSYFKYYRGNKKIDILSFKSKYSFLISFFNDLDKFHKLKHQKEETEEKKYNTVSEIYGDFVKTILMNTMIYQTQK